MEGLLWQKKTKAKRKSVSKKKADLVPDPSKAGDVADQAKLIEALRESEVLYRSIFELSPDGIITVDLKGVITKCNPAFLKFSGYLEKDIIGKHFTKIPTLQAKDISLYKKMVASLVRGKIPEPFESEWINIDGTIHNGSIRPSLLKKDGKVVGFHVVVQDITERKRAEEALRETQTMYQSLVETSQDLIWRADRDGRSILTKLGKIHMGTK